MSTCGNQHMDAALLAAVRQLAAVRAVVDRYRAVSDSPSQMCYLRDVEIALGADLPPVTDRDGRSDAWERAWANCTYPRPQ